jgi:hypothetical protein
MQAPGGASTRGQAGSLFASAHMEGKPAVKRANICHCTVPRKGLARLPPGGKNFSACFGSPSAIWSRRGEPGLVKFQVESWGATRTRPARDGAPPHGPCASGPLASRRRAPRWRRDGPRVQWGHRWRPRTPRPWAWGPERGNDTAPGCASPAAPAPYPYQGGGAGRRGG